jgi:hypothetical protein
LTLYFREEKERDYYVRYRTDNRFGN